jgi:hypothetical protein
MADLAARLNVSVPSVSTLELNDERGTAKAATIDRALAALDLARWDVVLPAAELEEILRQAHAIADEVAWTMALEAQNLTGEAKSALVRRLAAEIIAKR